MSDHDLTNNSDEDDNGSILSEALASGQAVQICRKPSKNKPKNQGMSLMSFFGAEEEDQPDQVVTAEPASLQNMRRIARERKKQMENGGGGGSADPSKSPTPRRRPRGRGRGPIQRSNTFDATSAIKRTATFDMAPQPMRALSPNRISMAAYRAPEGPSSSNKRALARSRTSNSADKAPPATSFFGSPSSNMDGSNNAEQRSSDASNKSKSYTEHEETIKRLTIQDDDIQKILQDPQAFAKLQKVLRKHGAVTNEVLRQVLPLYVKHQLNSSQAAAAKETTNNNNNKKRGDDGVGGEEKCSPAAGVLPTAIHAREE